MKVLIIIPAYNEEEAILKTYQKVEEYQKKLNIPLDILIVNDGSYDKTENILNKNKLNHLTLINNLGIGGAVQTGYKYAYQNDYDIAVQFDGDGQHDEKYIGDLLLPLIKDEADLTVGSRFIVKNFSQFKSTKARRCGIFLISNLIKITTGQKIYDPTSGFRACNKKLIALFAKDYPAEYPEPESLAHAIKAKYRVLEVPVEMKKRASGKSSIHTWKNVYYMLNVCLSIIITSIRRYK